MSLPEDPIDSYKMGQRVRMFVDFTDNSVPPVLADPDLVTLIYIEGDDNKVIVLQAGLANPSVGRWHFDLNMPQDGDKAVKPWIYRFEGTSAAPTGVNSANEMRFEVEPSPFYPPA